MRARVSVVALVIGVVSLTVGTLAGSVQEWGRRPGLTGGKIPALGYLRRGMGEGLKHASRELKEQAKKGRISARRA